MEMAGGENLIVRDRLSKSRVGIQTLLRQYDYELPRERVALAPASPRDRARLLVYRRSDGRVTDDFFFNLADYLPPRAILVLNDTKVIPARMVLRKPSRGLVHALYI